MAKKKGFNFDYVKHIVAIFLLLIYSFSANGAVVNLHYCGDKIASFSINALTYQGCCQTGEEGQACSQKSASCCSDKTIQLKLSPNQQKAEISFAHFVPQPALPAGNYDPSEIYISAGAAAVTFYSNAPPGSWRKIPLYKLLQRFTFYG